MTRNGQVRYELKTPYSNGTTHVLFEPLDIMYRMCGMPRVQEAQERSSPDWSPWSPGAESTSLGNGVFAPHSKYRAWLTPDKRGKGKKGIAAQQQPDQTPAERRASMT